jgi:hypothetical protein
LLQHKMSGLGIVTVLGIARWSRENVKWFSHLGTRVRACDYGSDKVGSAGTKV